MSALLRDNIGALIDGDIQYRGIDQESLRQSLRYTKSFVNWSELLEEINYLLDNMESCIESFSKEVMLMFPTTQGWIDWLNLLKKVVEEEIAFERTNGYVPKGSPPY